MDRHKIDDLGRDFFGRADEVTLVLAVLVVDDDDHLAVANIRGGFVNGGKWHLRKRLQNAIPFVYLILSNPEGIRERFFALPFACLASLREIRIFLPQSRQDRKVKSR